MADGAATRMPPLQPLPPRGEALLLTEVKGRALHEMLIPLMESTGLHAVDPYVYDRFHQMREGFAAREVSVSYEYGDPSHGTKCRNEIAASIRTFHSRTPWRFSDAALGCLEGQRHP